MKAFNCDGCQKNATSMWYGSDPCAVLSLRWRGGGERQFCSIDCANTWLAAQDSPETPPKSGMRWITEMHGGWSGAPVTLKVWPGATDEQISDAVENLREKVQSGRTDR